MKKLLFSLLVLGLISFNMFAQESSEKETKWQFRIRGVLVQPDESTNFEIIESGLNVKTQIMPEVDITYFFNKHWAAELILATPIHQVETVDTDLTMLGGPSNVDINAGHVWLLPPTLTLQYHFNGETAHPYIGAGVNYTMFYGEDPGDAVDIDYEDGFGFAMQLGLDYDINDKWFINADVKYILLSTDVDVNFGAAVLGAEVDLNPFLFGVGVGMRL
ncbi:OmpW family outer membrane protein [Lutibacter sp. TH_r2]|uniref:OmpW/AlkL family protein n=1 Tax=Lutibacter sp. TH_r2 TaxID=3082083 RepID=UPI002953F4FB|nr:OmpW family outer membrane protein [Lutibacter sp. TH_r2]MDV7188259.1 OmpW family outer membrane protein [Lutibacter sp. TH_r2]